MIHRKQRGMMVAMEGEKGMKRVSGAWACS